MGTPDETAQRVAQIKRTYESFKGDAEPMIAAALTVAFYLERLAMEAKHLRTTPPPTKIGGR